MTTDGKTGQHADRDTRRAWRKRSEAQRQKMSARSDLWESKARKAQADVRIRPVALLHEGDGSRFDPRRGET